MINRPAARIEDLAMEMFSEPRFYFFMFFLLVANVAEAVTGFGGIIIVVTIAANFYDIPWLVVRLVPINLLLSIYLVAKHRSKVDGNELIGGVLQSIRQKKLVPFRDLIYGILPSAIIGMVVGIVVFNSVEIESLKLAYGVFVLSFAVIELVKTVRLPEDIKLPPLSRIKSAIWLFGGGLMQGIYASGGPMIVYYSSRKMYDKGVFRATLSVLWTVLNLFIMISHIASGLYNTETLISIASLLPALVVGIWLGEIVHRRVNERLFRIVVFSILVFAGASLTYSAVKVFF
ncbi:MAG TPA: sulfite exporter TauE/SafE family protein [bacterium]|nr:sulfite exporter TauE/SafE family protein [bacterium]